jgi:hypothetical protein
LPLPHPAAIRRLNVSLIGTGPAHRHDYCDQAHMNTEFRAAFGISHGKFRRELH